jgi:hypothetical protein
VRTRRRLAHQGDVRQLGGGQRTVSQQGGQDVGARLVPDQRANGGDIRPVAQV